MAKQITELPNTDDLNKWADYWEMRCLCSIEKAFSVDDMRDLLQDNQIDEPSNGLSAEGYEGSNAGEKTDVLLAKVRDWFYLLESRKNFFGKPYPFQIISNRIELKKNLGALQRIYLNLLLASNLDYASNFTPVLTNWFERLSLEATRSLLPNNGLAQCHYFGKGKETASSKYRGNIRTKLEILGKDLHLPFREDFNRDCARDPNYLHAKSVGDKGLDIVAWLEFKDKDSLTPIFFGQCACGAEWEAKQFEAHPVVWEDIFQFNTKPTTILYIPRSYRWTDGEFIRRSTLHQLAFLDRLRLLRIVEKRKRKVDLLDTSCWKAVCHFSTMNLNYLN